MAAARNRKPRRSYKGAQIGKVKRALIIAAYDGSPVNSGVRA